MMLSSSSVRVIEKNRLSTAQDGTGAPGSSRTTTARIGEIEISIRMLIMVSLS